MFSFNFISSVFINVVKNVFSEAVAQAKAQQAEANARKLSAKAEELKRQLDAINAQLGVSNDAQGEASRKVQRVESQPVASETRVQRPVATTKVVEQPAVEAPKAVAPKSPKETPVKAVEQPKASKKAATPRAPKAASNPQSTQELIEASKITGQGEAFIVDGTFQIYCPKGNSDVLYKRVLRLARKVWAIEGVKPSPQRIYSLSEEKPVSASQSPKETKKVAEPKAAEPKPSKPSKKAKKNEAPVEQPKAETPKASKSAKQTKKATETKAQPKAEEKPVKASQTSKKSEKKAESADRAHCTNGQRIDWSKPESFTDSMAKIMMAHKLHTLSFGQKSVLVTVPNVKGEESLAEAKGLRLTDAGVLCVDVTRENGVNAIVSADFCQIEDLKKMNELTRQLA